MKRIALFLIGLLIAPTIFAADTHQKKKILKDAPVVTAPMEENQASEIEKVVAKAEYDDCKNNFEHYLTELEALRENEKISHVDLWHAQFTVRAITATRNYEQLNQRIADLMRTPVVSAPKTVVTPWKPTAFVQEEERLPVGYTGLNPKKFLDMFKSKIGGNELKKGEFETSEEFAQRTTNKDALLAPINTSDLYAFRMGNIDIKYDADAQAYIIGDASFSFSCWDPYPFKKSNWKQNAFSNSKGWVTCKVASVFDEYDTYVGSNAYGAAVTIDRYRGRDFALAFSNDSSMLSTVFSSQEKYHGYYKLQEKLSVPLEKARRLKDTQVAVLFVGQVSDAKIIKGLGAVIEPTIDKPTDMIFLEDAVPFNLKKIIYYIVQSGEILGQKDF